MGHSNFFTPVGILANHPRSFAKKLFANTGDLLLSTRAPSTTSSGPFARGTVTAIGPIIPNSPMVLATVSWGDGVTTQVNVTNLEIQPGNPPLTPR